MEGLRFAREVLARETWLPTPLLEAQATGRRLGLELWLKREDCTPIGSFKLRGAMVTVARYADRVPDAGVYVASAGNYGLAIALAARRRNIRVTVVAPRGATPSKLERIELCGATVVSEGDDFDAAKEFARRAAAAAGASFWEDGLIEEMAWGAATIATELLAHPSAWDYVLVPVGNGSLIKGIGAVMKAKSPQTAVIGLVPSGAPAMAAALQGRRWDPDSPIRTLADGLAVRVPIGSIVDDLRSLVDQVWVVQESDLLPAVRSLMELEQVLAEPSAAITVAAAAERRAEMAGRRVAAILTGSHLRASLLSEVARAPMLVT